MASINASGSKVVVLADSLVKFEGPAVSAEHGSLTVATSKGLSTHTGEITVVPGSNGWTEFEVKQVPDDTVQIIAQKGDVTVSDGSSTSYAVSQGQQTTVEIGKEKEEEEGRVVAPFPPAGGAVLDSPDGDLRRRGSSGWTLDLGAVAGQ